MKNKVPEGEIHVAINARSNKFRLTKPTGCHILPYQVHASKQVHAPVTDIKYCHYLLHCLKRIEGKAHEQYTAPTRLHSKRRNLQCACTWHHLCLRWNPVDLTFPWVVHSPFASYLHVLWWRTTTCTNTGR